MNDALFRQALAAQQAGDLQTAHRLYHQILRTEPGHFDALQGLARVYFSSGQFAEAEKITALAVKRNPRAADAWFLRGSALQRLDKHQEALAAFARALAEQPRFAAAMVNRGASLMSLKRTEEALKSFDAAIAVDSARAEAWNNRGNALSSLGRTAEAIESYKRVRALIPGMAETAVNLGTAYFGLKQNAEALKYYDEAIALRPSGDAWSGRGNVLFELHGYEEAGRAYESALAVDPDYKYARGNFAFCRLHCCDWNGIEDIKRETLRRLHAGKAVISPFQALALFSDPADQLRCAEIWAADKYPQAAALWKGERFAHEKIRVAYVSGDLRNHAVAKLIAGVFENHDRARFEIIGVPFGAADGSALEARVLGAFDAVLDARELKDAEVAARLRMREIDIAIDLMGFSGDCRAGIFAHRPAPVRVNFLGFAGTMAAEYMDYLIADKTVIVNEHRRAYRESIAYLPDTYLPWDSKQRIAETPPRAAAGLPEKGFVFASFNNSYKFGLEMFSLWMRLLHEIEGSVLWLHEGNEWAMRNLKREAAARGVSQERLIFAPFTPDPADHLARLTLADLFLDTLPYNAHATAIDALTAGVPVLTTPGVSFASRVAASLVRAAGIPEMIMASLSDYEALALKLAREPQMLADMKAKLSRNKSSAPLFDTVRFTRNLEAAFAAMHQRALSGVPPADFAV